MDTLDNIKMEKEKTCVYYNTARSQLEKELELGLGFAGVDSYIQAGCFECDGSNKCKAYFSLEQLGKIHLDYLIKKDEYER